MHATPDHTGAERAWAEALHWLLPIHYFYEKRGKQLPNFSFMDGEDVPYPYRSLLVHSNDMTPTLAAFHHSKIYLEVHQHEANDEFVMRLVTLHAEESDEAVEFGAIAIQLNGLPAEVREKVVEGGTPLGGLLGEYGVEHQGSPSVFFSVPADDLIAPCLDVEPDERLYGRCNQLLDSAGMVFADIVEILPRSGESERWVENVPHA